jgi:hypothetical protein
MADSGVFIRPVIALLQIFVWLSFGVAFEIIENLAFHSAGGGS